MSLLSAIPVVGGVLDGVFSLIDQGIEDKDEAAKLKAGITTAAQNADLSKFTQQLQAQAGVVTAEATGESWLQRNWRPILMLTIVVIVANNYLLAPYVRAFGGPELVLQLPERLWDLMTLGVGGYVVGRTAEKGIKEWKGAKNGS